MRKSKRMMLFALPAAGILVIATLVLAGRSSPEKEKLLPPTGSERVPGLPGPILALQPGQTGSPLYAGTGGGVYSSQDGGLTWQRSLRAGIWNGPVRDILSDPNDSTHLYVAIGNRLFQLDASEKQARQALKTESPLVALAVSPIDSKQILAASERQLHKSKDGGQSWSVFKSGLPGLPIYALTFDPKDPSVLLVLTDAGLYRCTDSGSSWQRIWISRPVEAEPDSTANQPEETTDEEAENPSLIRPRSVVADARTGTLYVASSKGIFASTDQGAGWNALPSAGLASSNPIRLFHWNTESGAQLYAATSSGLFYYQSHLGRWMEVRAGIASKKIYAVTPDKSGENLWVGTDRGLLRIPAPVPSPLPALVPQGAANTRPLPAAATTETFREPTIREVQRAAIRYAEVMPEKIRGWRILAQARNLIPRFTVSVGKDRNKTIASSTTAGVTRFTVGPEDSRYSLDYGFTWDFANLVWDSAQTSIDTRSRLMVQLRQDTLEEVTRLYFERRRLQAEFQANPAEDPLLLRERSLRIEELTAQLDALTGGLYSDFS